MNGDPSGLKDGNLDWKKITDRYFTMIDIELFILREVDIEKKYINLNDEYNEIKQDIEGKNKYFKTQQFSTKLNNVLNIYFGEFDKKTILLSLVSDNDEKFKNAITLHSHNLSNEAQRFKNSKAFKLSVNTDIKNKSNPFQATVLIAEQKKLLLESACNFLIINGKHKNIVNKAKDFFFTYAELAKEYNLFIEQQARGKINEDEERKLIKYYQSQFDTHIQKFDGLFDEISPDKKQYFEASNKELEIIINGELKVREKSFIQPVNKKLSDLIKAINGSVPGLNLIDDIENCGLFKKKFKAFDLKIEVIESLLKVLQNDSRNNRNPIDVITKALEKAKQLIKNYKKFESDQGKLCLGQLNQLCSTCYVLSQELDEIILPLLANNTSNNNNNNNDKLVEEYKVNDAALSTFISDNRVEADGSIYKLQLSKYSEKLQGILQQRYPGLSLHSKKENKFFSSGSFLGGVFSLGGSKRNSSLNFGPVNSSGKTGLQQKTRSFLGLLETIQPIQEGLKSVYSNHDYKFLNALGYALKTKQKVPITGYAALSLEDIIKFGMSTNNQLSNRLKEIINIKSVCASQSLVEERAEKILELTNAAEFLPEDWCQEIMSDGDYFYPNSSSNHLMSWSAHLDKNKIIAAAGPGAQAHYSSEQKCKFFNLILQEKPKQILALGRTGNDFFDYFQLSEQKEVKLIYQETNQEKIEYTITKEKNQYGLRITLKTELQQHSLYYNQIEVYDNSPVHLKVDDLPKLLAIYNNYDEGNRLLIHCASGVGRTGQVRWLFALLDRFKVDPEFSRLIDSLLDNNKLKLNEGNYIIKVFTEELYRLRKIRYAVQDQKQIEDCLPMILLLRATQLNNSKQDLEKLYQELYKNKQPQPANFLHAINLDANLLPKLFAKAAFDNNNNNNNNTRSRTNAFSDKSRSVSVGDESDRGDNEFNLGPFFSNNSSTRQPLIKANPDDKTKETLPKFLMGSAPKITPPAKPSSENSADTTPTPTKK